MSEMQHELAVICNLIKIMKENYPHQIGKTAIQKMVYLLTREKITNHRYSLYNYGPYSSDVMRALDICEYYNNIDIEWKKDIGYEISPGKNVDFGNLDPDEIGKITKTVTKYSSYNALDLSIITTALYVLDNESINSDQELVDAVIEIKPKYKNKVEKILRDSNIIPIN
ncbi:hypothetical protein AZH53_08560 [Methanomicrobiaceae archaeon CYW5]|uniref:hypothetical protein n=1 Tax=Methanovulcanius yangii TaxID=1789227 RepID=UPI0029CA1D78|nr:hypothetical protein [Methanovulcanius yangii]MBT8508455.1 hypothetical protein [Methanovulcanius yangii]